MTNIYKITHSVYQMRNNEENIGDGGMRRLRRIESASKIAKQIQNKNKNKKNWTIPSQSPKTQIHSHSFFI